MYSVLVVGLFVVGIPHGAMDHMTEALSKNKRITVSFVLKYLSLMAAVYLLWLFSPSIALLSFLLYSAWHFGETDTEEWGIQSPFIGMLWGTLLFVGLFTSHVEELQEILLLLEVQGLNPSLNYPLYFSIAIGISFILAAAFRRFQLLVLVLAFLACVRGGFLLFATVSLSCCFVYDSLSKPPPPPLATPAPPPAFPRSCLHPCLLLSSGDSFSH